MRNVDLVAHRVSYVSYFHKLLVNNVLPSLFVKGRRVKEENLREVDKGGGEVVLTRKVNW